MKITFNRTLEKALVEWKSTNERKPLILKGARQVGKTYLMKWFGESHFPKCAYFNFDETPALKSLFESSKDVHAIIENLSLVGQINIDRDTLIIFDEIQECLPALTTLKYFHENMPWLSIICAGSLLGVSLGKQNSFPVGKVTFLNLYPLTFTEFLEQASTKLYNYIIKVNKLEPIPQLFFEELTNQLKKYLITGGLPASALALLQSNDFAKSDHLLKDLLKGYEYDFAKHPITKDIAKINLVFQSLPSQLGRENKKFVYQLVKPGARAREYEDAIVWLENAGLIYRVRLCTVPRLPLTAYHDLSSYKIYAFDVGILRKLSKLNPIAYEEGERLFVEFKGALIENYILQSLMAACNEVPHYWTSGNEAEVDFLIEIDNTIIPIEVKAGQNTRSASLTQYTQSHKPELRIRYSMKNLNIADGLLNIPLFLSDQTLQLIKIANASTIM